MIIASVVGATAAFLCIGIVILLVMRKSSKTGDDFTSNLKKQTAGTNSSMVLTNSNNTNSNFNKALTDSGRSHLTVDNNSAANSDLKLEIRTNSSLSDQEHHNPTINWEDELIMNNTLLTAQNMYNGQHVQAFETSNSNHLNNHLSNVYDTQQFNQRYIIANSVPNYESIGQSIYNYPPTAQLVANGQLANTAVSNSQIAALSMTAAQPISNILNNNLINNNIVTANKYTSPAKQQSPPTYHNLANLSSTNNLYLPSYTDYGQLIDYMQVQTTSNSQQTSQVDNLDNSTILGYTIATNGQPIITATTNLPTTKQQCESAYSTLQTDSRYRAAQCTNNNNNYATRTPAYATNHQLTNHQLSINQPLGLPASPLYSNQISNAQTSNSQNSAIQVPNNTTNLRNYITNSSVVNSNLASVNNQATLATHV